MKYLLLFIISITQCFAIDVVPIKKNSPAPEDGFFVNPPNMKELRKINETKKVLEKENIKLKSLAEINEARVTTYKKFAESAEEEMRWEKTKGSFKGVGGFILGVLATSAAAYAAIRISK